MGEKVVDELTAAAQRYVTAREVHAEAVRNQFSRGLSSAAMRRATREVVASDGVHLTDALVLASEVVHVWRMETSVEFERAERALAAAVEASENSPLRHAAVAVLEDAREPWRVFDPEDAVQRAASEARVARHREAIERLESALRARARN